MLDVCLLHALWLAQTQNAQHRLGPPPQERVELSIGDATSAWLHASWLSMAWALLASALFALGTCRMILISTLAST